MPGLYIHIPFCGKKCPYCNFYSVPHSAGAAASYAGMLAEQVKALEPEFSTVYVGGGTPSVLDVNSLGRILGASKKAMNGEGEFTVEVNPESVDRDKLRLFLDNGVNRVSVGAQSFNDKKLRTLGRIHGARDAERAILASRKAGFKNISVDLIFGAGEETMTEWRLDLEKAAGFDARHISCYSLTLEKGVNMKTAGDDAMKDMYEFSVDYLNGRGFCRYEVSNFAEKGFECRHNMSYWEGEPYAGLGPSAVSYIGGTRSENVSDVLEYARRYKEGADLKISMERLSPLESAKELASVKIRTTDGIGYDWFRAKTGFDFLEIESHPLAELLGQGLVDRGASRVCLTRKGFLFCDSVSEAFL
ncbi:MAG: radical SAM family heme chaperone HemW [Candidatus Omnitrophota bacterium]